MIPTTCPWCGGRAELLAAILVCATPDCQRYDSEFATRAAALEDRAWYVDRDHLVRGPGDRADGP